MTLHDRRDELAAFQITVTHGSEADRFKVRIAEGGAFEVVGNPLLDYAKGGAANFKDALRQALHYVSPALAGEVFTAYYDALLPAPAETWTSPAGQEFTGTPEYIVGVKTGWNVRANQPRPRCKFSATCEHHHPDDIATHPNGDSW